METTQFLRHFPRKDIKSPMDAMNFMYYLYTWNKMYHPDEDALEIINFRTDEPIFTPEEAEIVDYYMAQAFQLSNFDPCAFFLDLVKEEEKKYNTLMSSRVEMTVTQFLNTYLSEGDRDGFKDVLKFHVYDDGMYIELTNELKYRVTIERSTYVTDTINEAEKILWDEFARDEFTNYKL